MRRQRIDDAGQSGVRRPATNGVGLRWIVHSHVPTEHLNGKTILWETLTGEYSFLNGGGSTNNPLHKWFDIQSNDNDEDFVGIASVGMDPTINGTYTNWFAIADGLAGQGPHVAGGFAVDLDGAALFGTK